MSENTTRDIAHPDFSAGELATATRDLSLAPAPTAAPERQTFLRRLIPALAILLFTLQAYSPALRGTFLWDDDHHFSENPLMTQPGGLARLWTSERALYYPLTSTTFWLARRVWGLNPLPYHLLNVLLHGINAILLWRLLRRLRVPAPWLAGAIFALHPVNAQSVAWMTELKNCQSGLFYLLALLAWVSWRERGRPWSYAAALGCFLLALLSKTSTVTLPLALVIIHLWRREPLTRRAAAGWLPFFALSGLAALATVVMHNPMVGGAEWSETAAQRVILAARGTWFYLGKFFMPLQLTFVYPRWQVDAAHAAQWLWVAGMMLLGGGLWACRGRAWGRVTGLALAYYVCSLLPVLNFFRMYYTRYAYTADHWQYLAAMGTAAWLAGGYGWLAGRVPQIRAGVKNVLIPAAVILALGGLTWRQAHIYRNPVTLWTDTIKKNPRAAISYNNLGSYFISRGQYEIADRVLQEGLALNPGNDGLLTFAGASLVCQNRPKEALPLLEQAARTLPEDPEVLNNIGSALGQLGRNQEALHYFERALRQKPDMPEIYYNLARILLREGRTEEARGIVERGLRVLPGNATLLGLRSEVSQSRSHPWRAAPGASIHPSSP